MVYIYAPNNTAEQDFCFENLTTSLQNYDYQTIILFGDFNAVCNLKLDRKEATGWIPLWGNKLLKTVYDLAQNLEIKNIWRFKNSKKSGFTFFPSRNNTFSWIDDIEIFKLFADHNPIIWSLRSRGKILICYFIMDLWRDTIFIPLQMLKTFFSIT